MRVAPMYSDTLLVNIFYLKICDNFLKKGASLFMVKHIMANIYRWICDDAPYIPENINTVHEQSVKNAIINQNNIEWHQYLRGLHSKIWNIAHIQWNIEAKQQNSTHLWNVYAIPAIINFSISIWVERCTQIKKLRALPDHESC